MTAQVSQNTGAATLAQAMNLGKIAGSMVAATIKETAQVSLEKGREAVTQLQAKAGPQPAPCAICGLPTKAGDGGACGDAENMAASAEVTDQAPSSNQRCYSCLTASEAEVVQEASVQYLQRLDAFYAGVEQSHSDPAESGVEMAHRLGTLAMKTLATGVEYCPLLPQGISTGVNAMYGMVKYGPLAAYAPEAMEAVGLLATLASKSGVVGRKSSEESVAPRTTLGQASDTASDVTELSVCLYYLLMERRNALGLDPDLPKHRHAKCPAVETSLLAQLSEALTLATPIAYAGHAAEAQRQLRLLRGSWQLVMYEPAGPGGRPAFVLAADKQAKKSAVLIPGTRSPADCVTDLRALPVRLDLGPGTKPGWVHRGMFRQACAIARSLSTTLARLDKDGYEITFVGHSLGAGVSALAGVVVRLGIECQKLPRARSLCFATPACCNVAVAKFCEAHAITVIRDDDLVPRLSIETSRKLRAELDERREITRVYFKEDIDALRNIQNITEKKRRMNIEDAPQTAQELASLGIPAPLPEVEAAEEKRAAEATRVAEEKAKVAVTKGSSKQKSRRKGCCFCGSAQDGDTSEGEERSSIELGEPEEPEEIETDDPVEVKLYPPGRLIQLYRQYGARRAAWIKRTHPTLHHIEVITGVADGHKGESYKEGLREALSAAQGSLPVRWKSFSEVARCCCCNADFAWASVMRSEPHRLQSRHHCHGCGDVVCDGCSQNRRALPQAGISREVRICDRCYLNGGVQGGSKV